jgi:hypothetical protein
MKKIIIVVVINKRGCFILGCYKVFRIGWNYVGHHKVNRIKKTNIEKEYKGLTPLLGEFNSNKNIYSFNFND